MSIVAYRRVSSVDQNLDRQLPDLASDRVFEDKCSGATVNRPQWKACLDYMREGDTLHVHSLDRLARSTDCNSRVDQTASGQQLRTR
jgi:DNA invertase Pin-like site-specific DNA recombinase